MAPLSLILAAVLLYAFVEMMKVTFMIVLPALFFVAGLIWLIAKFWNYKAD